MTTNPTPTPAGAQAGSERASGAVLTDERRAQICARLDAAKGEGARHWSITPDRHWAEVYAGDVLIARCPDDDDAEFIAHAPSDLAALLAENERLRYLGFDVSPGGRPRNNRDGACTCDYNPETTSGPEEDCPFHGRAYADWVIRTEAAEVALERVRAALARWQASDDVAVATILLVSRLTAALDGAHPTPSDGSGTDG